MNKVTLIIGAAIILLIVVVGVVGLKGKQITEVRPQDTTASIDQQLQGMNEADVQEEFQNIDAQLNNL